MKKPNQRRARFIAEYLIDPNAAQAARLAGYSPHSASETGRALLRKPDVKAAIDAQTAEIFDRLEVKAEQVIREAMRIAFADLSRLFDKDGKPLPLGEIDAETLAGLDITMSYDKHGNHTATHLRRLDKMAALLMLGKHLKLFTDRVEVANGREIAEAMAEARERAP